MWTDNETTQDYLNFSSIAKTVAEIIEQARSRPVSIGVSGAWGVGKSSMIKLIRQELESNDSADQSSKLKNYIFIEFNAWLYQGYDDARAALIDVVASKLEDEANNRKTATEKVKELIGRVRWLRAAKLLAVPVAAAALGMPVPGMFGALWNTGKGVLTDSEVDAKTTDEIHKGISTSNKSDDSLIKDKDSPPKQIDALRSSFESILQEMEVTLVVLIDDLDRCLPETAISTLEAIRLLLFLENTAFVIAADNTMIKYAVKKHFQGIEENELITNYFDKLIQVPIQVPPLGTQEVRAYMMMLFIDNSHLKEEIKENLRVNICEQLGKSWQGKRVDIDFIKSVYGELPEELITNLHVADRLAPLMTISKNIAGNPRLIKRFLNALSIRMSMSKAQGVGVDEAVLAKLLLFERCGNPKAYAELIKNITESANGKPEFLSEWEFAVIDGNSLNLSESWKDDFVEDWLRLAPTLSDKDLRGALYVSREHTPLITMEDKLSTEASKVLNALLIHPDMSETSQIKEDLKGLSKLELSIIFDRLLEKAREEQEWGTPQIFTACIVVASIDETQGTRLASFLKDRPISQISASIVPKIKDEVWASRVLTYWKNNPEVKGPVKKAIERIKE